MGTAKTKALKKTMALAACLLGLLLATTAWAQNFATMKGRVSGDDGKPLVGATVTMVSKENGRKYPLTTNKKGDYFSIAIIPGTYDITLTKDGKTLYSTNGYPVSLGKPDGINELDFDLKKLREEDRGRGLSEAQKKEMEEAQKENTKIKSLNEMLAQAKAAQDANNYDQAVAILTQATTADPTKDLLWFKLGDAYRGAKKWDDAARSYEKAIAIKPMGAYYNNLGEAYAKANKTDLALKAYTDAANVDPTGAGGYYYNLGAVLTNTGKIDLATAAFDKAIAADPTRAEAYYQKGVNLLGKATLKGDKVIAPPGTAEAFNKYLELKPDGPYSKAAKELLASIGATVETSISRRKKK